MKKLGVIACFYDCARFVDKILEPWLSFPEIEVSIVHGQFKEYAELGYEDRDCETIGRIIPYVKEVKTFITGAMPEFDGKKLTESEIRNIPLTYLKSRNCENFMILDGDEIYSQEEIQNILNFIDRDKFISWYRIEMKNLTFNEKTYTKGFNPPRIFRNNCGQAKLREFHWDNDVMYNLPDGTIIDYRRLASQNIPTTLVNPLHYSWCDKRTCIKKINYHKKHFAHPMLKHPCSFKWDTEKDCLAFCEEYYLERGLEFPALFTV